MPPITLGSDLCAEHGENALRLGLTVLVPIGQGRDLASASLKRIAAARARTRRRVWAQLPQLPCSKVAGTDLGDAVVLDVDVTLVTAHSEKQSAAPTFKGGFGYHPLAVWCDNTTEMLSIQLRRGNAGRRRPRRR